MASKRYPYPRTVGVQEGGEHLPALAGGSKYPYMRDSGGKQKTREFGGQAVIRDGGTSQRLLEVWRGRKQP